MKSCPNGQLLIDQEKEPEDLSRIVRGRRTRTGGCQKCMKLSRLDPFRNFVPRSAVRKVAAVRLFQVEHDGMASEHAADRVNAILAVWSGKEIQQSQSGTPADKVAARDMLAVIVQSMT